MRAMATVGLGLMVAAGVVGCGSEARPMGTPCTSDSSCGAGMTCCSDCDGNRFCASACPGKACLPDDAGEPGPDGDVPPADGDVPPPPPTDADTPVGDATVVTNECRSNADCSRSTYCAPPGAPMACGVPCAVTRECDPGVPTDCPGATEVCIEFQEPCCVGTDLFSSMCAPACTSSSCRPDELCDVEGRCVPMGCDAGYTCPPFTACFPMMSGEAGHGCMRQTCTADGECAGPSGVGFCVERRCYESLGECRPPAA